jgi:hypothetical protein
MQRDDGDATLHRLSMRSSYTWRIGDLGEWGQIMWKQARTRSSARVLSQKMIIGLRTGDALADDSGGKACMPECFEVPC